MYFKSAPFVICLIAFGIQNPPDENSKLYELLATLHYKKLPYVDVEHTTPLVICFSGTPGMGKTYLAKKMEEEYQGLRISTDEIRELLKAQGITVRNESILEEYLLYLLNSNTIINKILILDCSIDRRASKLFSFLNAKKIPYFVIRIAASPECAIERIAQRENENSAHYIRFFSRWYEDYESFLETHTPDCTIDNEVNGPVALDEAFKGINALLGRT